MRLPPQCEGCPAAPTALGFCPPSKVEPWTRLVAWGESPGATELETGHGFSGAAGRLLRSWLRRAGLSVCSAWPDDPPGSRREEVAFKNTQLCRQPGNLWLGKEQSWECMRRHGHASKSIVMGLSGSTMPTTGKPPESLEPSSSSPPPSIAFGANAVEALTGYRLPIQKARGSLLPLRSDQWVGHQEGNGSSEPNVSPTPTTTSPSSGDDPQGSGGLSSKWLTAALHPAFLVRGGGQSNPNEEQGKSQSHLEPLLAVDSRRALNTTSPCVPSVRYLRSPDLLTDSPPSGALVSVDIEGSGGQPNIVGVSWGEGEAVVFPWSHKLKEWLSDLFTRVTPTFHNAAFDIPELELAGVKPPEVWVDTINLAALYDPSLPMNLQFQVLTHVEGSTTWKNLVDHQRGPDYCEGIVRIYRDLWTTILTRLERNVPETGTEWMALYNGLDTAYGLALANRLTERLKSQRD